MSDRKERILAILSQIEKLKEQCAQREGMLKQLRKTFGTVEEAKAKHETLKAECAELEAYIEKKLARLEKCYGVQE